MGEHHCRVIIEVADLSADGWRRLIAEPELSWRRIAVPRHLSGQAGITGLPRRRRSRARVVPLVKVDAPMPALLEVSGTASGTAAVAKQRLATQALVALRSAGLRGEALGAAAAEAAGTDSGGAVLGEDLVWPTSNGVLIFGPSEQQELDRRFELACSVWSLGVDRIRRPEVPSPGQRRRRTVTDLVTGLCVLPLLAMAVPTVGPWLDRRSWALWIAVASVCVAVALAVAHTLSARWPLLAVVRGRGLRAAGLLLALLLLARLLVAVPLPPVALMVTAAVLAAVLFPIALRLLPVTHTARLALAGLVGSLVLVAAPVGDLCNAVYLGRLGLRATDVTQTFAQRWWSGAFFGATTLAGVALAVTLWGVVYQLDAVGRRSAKPSTPLLAVCGLVYLAALLAMAAAEAGNQAAAGADELPAGWGGIAPVWVCWSPPPGVMVPFAGRALPPSTASAVWLGSADARFALWSAQTGGATVSDQVQLRVRDTAGPCP